MAENRNAAAGMTTCCRCSGKWGGLKTAHCSACHNTFSTPGNFDRHRTGTHPGGRWCLPPAEVGLVDAGRAYPCWGQPGRDEELPDGGPTYGDRVI